MSVARVPQIMQMEAAECGAACLAMVCAYYEKYIPLSKVRLDCGVSRDGSSALALVQTARSYGFETTSVTCDLAYLRHQAQLPAIIHWGFDHYVVLDGFFGRKAVINDPARGKVRVPMETLDRMFTGVCMSFTPGPRFEKQSRRSSVSRYVLGRVGLMWRSMGFAMLCTLMTTIVTIGFTLMNKVFLDSILSSTPGWLQLYGAAFLGLILIQFVTSLIEKLAMRRFRTEMTILGSVRFLWYSLCLPMEFFTQRYAADIAGRMDEAEEMSSIIASWIVPLLVNVLMAIFYVWIMLSTSVPLTAIGLVCTVLILSANLISRTSQRNYAENMAVEQAHLQTIEIGGISMIDTIKSLGAETGYFNRWADRRASLNRIIVHHVPSVVFSAVIPEFLQELSSLLILSLGVLFVMDGRLTLGVLIAFQSFMNQFLYPIEHLIASHDKVAQLHTSVTRIDDILSYPKDPLLAQGDASRPLVKLAGDIEFRDLVFGYNHLQQPILQDLSLKIPRGKKLAIVGRTGSGKSTLGKLMLGLYQPWSGDILLDGVNRGEYPREVLAASIGVVDQDIKVFPGTLMENLKFWDPTIKDEAVVQACKDAMIHDEIMLREGGYYCQVEENGRNFSGGQLERFEIARVLAANPSILFLDEATNALDADTEVQIMRNIWARGLTTVVISHRLAAIKECDEIIVIDQGRIVERGTHAGLFASGGLYSHLVMVE
ncbi:MAG: cysteine peptidase family C39 domain-containing protein [Sphaerochaetaceae bacterium]|nr:cysteine peptidase family C39 domain-containing protein [Spirochaetales bacterium]MDY5499504.1 cysteine peptidase family C39 domain-containing protein [Sphaerochaetaceae bacterium]